MKNLDPQLKLQAYLDGELSGREAAEVKTRLERDVEAGALMGELRNTKHALAGNELECRLPETREFFWSKIEREIERQGREATSTPRHSWFAWVQRHLISVSSATALTCVLALVALRSTGSPSPLGEMELASEDMGAYTFRDPQEQMTMVWFYNRDDSQLADSASLASVDSE